MLKKFAEDLKKQREENKISLQDISRNSRLHISVFEKMESGDFNFQPQTYIRAFLKQYARFAGMNEDEVLYNYGLAKSGNYTGKNFTNQVPPVEQKKEIPEEKSTDENIGGTKFKKEKTLVTVDSYSRGGLKKEDKTSTNKINIKSKIIVSSVFLKTLFAFIVSILLLTGIYFLAKLIFFPQSSGINIIRQNFEDVVKESEKKILGKKSEEEIADSIKKSDLLRDSLENLKKDSLKLEIKGLETGTVYVITDSINIDSPERYVFSKNKSKIWKARNFFLISAGNTSSFELFLNEEPVTFENKTLRKVKLTKQDIETRKK